MIVLAREDINVEPTSDSPTPSVEKIAKDRPKNLKDLAKVDDDKKVHWVEVREKFPEISDFLNKNLFKGKKELTVKQIKDLITEFNIEDADKYWISLDKWDGMQREIDEPQMVVQLNISKKVQDEIKTSDVLTDFFNDFFQKFAGGMHPMHENTLAWARVYKFPEKWVIEEIQSDMFGASTDVGKKGANSSIEEILEDFEDHEKKEIVKFLSESFDGWDKQIVSAIFEMARENGVKDVWIFDEDVKKKVLQSKSKLKRYYRVVPRDLGFKKEKFEHDGKTLPAWHRAVASKSTVEGFFFF